MNNRDLDPPMDSVTCLRNLRAWLRERLAHGIAHVPGAQSPSGYHQHPNSWTAVQIAEWDVRQHLTEIENTLDTLGNKEVRRG